MRKAFIKLDKVEKFSDGRCKVEFKDISNRSISINCSSDQCKDYQLETEITMSFPSFYEISVDNKKVLVKDDYLHFGA